MQLLKTDTIAADRVPCRAPDIRDAFFDRLYDLAAADRDVLFLTADMGAFSLDRFKADLRRQYINVGVAEQNLVSVAAGLALSGKRVFIYAIAPFVTQRCYEQIKVDLCCMRLPVTIVGIGAGIAYSGDGPTHHAVQDVANIGALPGVTILNPCDAISAAVAAEEGYHSDGPVYVRLDKGQPDLLYSKVRSCSAGITELRSGRDIALIATGVMTHRALAVAERLATSGIDAGVLDVFRLKPLDVPLLHRLSSRYVALVVIEEHVRAGGLGSTLEQALLEVEQRSLPYRWYGLPEGDARGYGDREWMHRAYGLDATALGDSISGWWRSTGLTRGVPHPPSSCPGPGSWTCRLRSHDFAELVGIRDQEVPAPCLEDLRQFDYSYRRIEGAERDALVLGALQKLEAGQLSVAGREKQPLWEQGWAENFRRFLTTQGDLEELVPAYYRPGQPCRFRGDLVQGSDPRFEYNVFRLVRSWVFATLLAEVSSVYEFGCGPGHNLVTLAKRYPDKHLCGADWASSAVELVNAIARQYGFDLEARVFDMFSPDESFAFRRNAGVVTFGALEQLGGGYEAFVRFVLRRRPTICVHVEPLVEFYDEKRLIDYLAIKHHRQRNMLHGFLPYLKRLEGEGEIQIERIQHVAFGSMLTDGWSYVVWRPRECL